MHQLFDEAHFERPLLLSSFVLVFIDDMLIFSKTAEDHQRHLHSVFELMHKEKLHIKSSLFVWVRSAVLGFVVGPLVRGSILIL